MGAKGILNIVELHIEKILLGLGAATLIGLIVYTMMGPNKVEYGGRELGPSEIAPEISAKADQLRVAIRNASVPAVEVPVYASRLKSQHEAGIFGRVDPNAPQLPEELPWATAFGLPLPELAADDGAKDVRLVTPLPPKIAPVMTTGISLAYRQKPDIRVSSAGAPGVSPTPDEPEPEPEECAWVTGASYFPIEAQTREMTNNGYAGYLAKVYLVGVDVQRQEMTADGEFSPWQEVQPSLAMPQFELPTPVFDERSNELLNQPELDAALAAVREWQLKIWQPDFYPIEAGDYWELPPLPGYEEEDVVEVAVATPRQPEPERPRPPVQPGPGYGGGMRPPGRTGGITPRGNRPDPREIAAARKELARDLREAQQAMQRKEFAEAERIARKIMDHQHATAALRGRAGRILAQAEQLQGQTGPGGSNRPEGWVLNPESDEVEPAVWFHDDRVEPGKTYRYRMRLRLWNRYVGKRDALRDPTQASRATVVGDWSLPSAPVTVAPKRHFFVRGRQFGDEVAANVDVFVWHGGYWYKEDFTVQVGDVIGDVKTILTNEYDESGNQVRAPVDFSTGAVVLDIRPDEPTLYRRSVGNGEFTYNEAKSLVLVYLDPADGQVKQRIDRQDRADPTYKELKEQQMR